MSTTIRQSVTFTEPQIAYLKAEAGQLGITVSDLIRRIIDQHRGALHVRGDPSAEEMAELERHADAPQSR